MYVRLIVFKSPIFFLSPKTDLVKKLYEGVGEVAGVGWFRVELLLCGVVHVVPAGRGRDVVVLVLHCHNLVVHW